jgi:hypothetical protein
MSPVPTDLYAEYAIITMILVPSGLYVEYNIITIEIDNLYCTVTIIFYNMCNTNP